MHHPLLLALLTVALLAPASALAAPAAPVGSLVFVGTYTGPKSRGIHAFRLVERAGEPALEPLGLAAEMAQPSFLALDPARGLLFAISESATFGDRPTGWVASFRIDRASGRLEPLSTASSGAPGPCHLLLDRTGRTILVANYSGAAVASLPVDATGRLGQPVSVLRHEGSSVHPTRQKAPHPHAVTLDPTERFLYVCDLGIDQVRVYRFDAAAHRLTPHTPAHVSLRPGAGPRHLAFRPDGRFAYAVNELDSTVTVFRHDAAAGRLETVESVSTLPAGFTGRSTTAEIQAHPNGRWLYASNRGHDSLAVFAIDAQRGTLTARGHVPTGGRTPRHFGWDSTGTIVALGNQDSDTVVLGRLDPTTGAIRPSPHVAAVPSPVCLVFLPPAP